MKVFFLSILIICAISLSLARHPLRIHERVVDGSPASKNQFPWQAFLMCCGGVGQNQLCSSCGGSLITPRWILTAAHCTQDNDHFDIGLGSINKFEPQVKLQSTEKYEHYVYDNFLLKHDVAMIKLPMDVKRSDSIRPIQLANKDIGTLNKAIVTASGFGRLVYQGASAQTLNYINLEVISNTQCQEYHPRIVFPSTICAFAMGHTQTLCHGDSGGPLVTKVGNDHVQVGVISFTYSRCSGNGPTGYARVSSHLDWINFIMEEYK